MRHAKGEQAPVRPSTGHRVASITRQHEVATRGRGINRRLLREAPMHLLLLLGGIAMVMPFAWMLLGSLKTLAELFSVPPTWFPEELRWQNYSRAWNALPFGPAYINSLYIALTIVAAQLLTCSMAAYAFARIEFPLRNVLFVLFLATLMVPIQVTIVPLFLLIRALGWYDSHLALIVPNALFNAFGVFLLRQFISGVPLEYEEAAIVDGATRWTVYWRIVLPLLKPALAALAIFSFLAHWNSFFGPLIFLSSPQKWTVPLLISQFKGQFVTDYTVILAATSLAVVPVLLVYILGQRYIIEGVTLTGIKR
jgi:multiple sugar transport system permease protein